MGATRGKPLSAAPGKAAPPAAQGRPTFPKENVFTRPAPTEQERYTTRKTNLEAQLGRVGKREESLRERLSGTQAIIGGYQTARGYSPNAEAAPGTKPARPASGMEMGYAQRAAQMQNTLGRIGERKQKLQSRLDQTNEFLKKYQAPTGAEEA